MCQWPGPLSQIKYNIYTVYMVQLQVYTDIGYRNNMASLWRSGGMLCCYNNQGVPICPAGKPCRQLSRPRVLFDQHDVPSQANCHIRITCSRRRHGPPGAGTRW